MAPRRVANPLGGNTQFQRVSLSADQLLEQGLVADPFSHNRSQLADGNPLLLHGITETDSNGLVFE